MKKSTKITYIWIRVLMTVVFAIGLLGVFFNEDQSIKSENLFICSQSGLFLIISFLPNFLKKFELDIPDFLYIIFIFFILAHYFCGEILGFFAKVKWWDSALHTFSGMLIALLSFSLINLLNKNSDNFKLNIGFTALFAFSFTIMVGVLWEIFEFCSDLWFDSNMQRAYVSTMNGRGEALVGQAALADTMKDLILDSCGAGVVCIVCIIAVSLKKIKIEDLSFIKKKKKVVAMSEENIESLEKHVTEQKINATLQENVVLMQANEVNQNNDLNTQKENDSIKKTDLSKTVSSKKTTAKKSTNKTKSNKNTSNEKTSNRTSTAKNSSSKHNNK